MSSSSPTSTLNVEMRPGKLPMLRVDAIDDGPRWAAEHRDALRAAVVQHGSLLVRGLRLRDVAGTEAVFRRLGSLMLVRNYNDEIGASIAEAFGTDDRRTVESYCCNNAIQFEWQPDGALRTWQRRSALVHHPLTGQQCWFNQIAFLNEWTIDPEVREYLVDVYGEEGLPFNTRFGNGDAIGADIVQLINEVYQKNTVREPWQSGDLMLVDNVRTAHGRERYEGPREVLVAMADAVHLADRSPTIEVTVS